MKSSGAELFGGFFDTGVDDFLSGCSHGEILWLAKKMCNMKVMVGQPTMTSKVEQWASTAEARDALPDIARRAQIVMREVKTHGYDASSRLFDSDAYLVTGNAGWSTIQTFAEAPEEISLANFNKNWKTKCDEGYDLKVEEEHALNDEANVESTFYRSMTLDPSPTREDFVAVKIATIAQDCIRVNEQSGKVMPVVGQPCAGVKKQFSQISAGLASMAMRKSDDRVYPRYYMYDGLMNNVRGLRPAVARRLALSAPKEWAKYIAAEVDGRFEGTPTMVPAPKPKKFKQASKVLYNLRPLFSRRGMGHIASSIVDGVPLAPPMRQVVNTLNDIYVPDDVKVVYWATSNKDNVERLRRRTKRDDVVFFYDGEYLSTDEERKIFKDGSVITGGVIPTKNFRDVTVGENKVLYIDLSKSSATVLKSKVFVDSVSQVAAHDARKMECTAKFDYYIVRVHALALCPEFWENGAKLEYPRAPLYYVSAQISSMNILATNVSRAALGVDPLTREDIVPVYLAIAGLWNQFPVTRLNIATLSYWSSTGVKSVRLFPRVQYVPMRKIEQQKELFDADIDETSDGFDLTFSQAKAKEGELGRRKEPDPVQEVPMSEAAMAEEEDTALDGIEFDM